MGCSEALGPRPYLVDSVLVALPPDAAEGSGQVSRNLLYGPHSLPIAVLRLDGLLSGLIRTFLPLLPLPHLLCRKG